MPTYEYRCDACGHEFEIEQRITADKLKKCPKCKKMKLVRLVGTGNFILKGGGWYADLYSGKSNVKGDGGSKPPPGESSSSSSDSSSEPKKDSSKKKSKKKKASKD
jgi:putative FmdB family regulatory protein